MTELEVMIKVQDFGIGLTEEDMRKLFRPYFKSSNKASQQMNTSSHGLGLSIC